MALTTCPDCDNSVSRSAESCPHCGRPMRRPKRKRRASSLRPNKVQTVEQTSKRWKALRLLSAIVFWPTLCLWALLMSAQAYTHAWFLPSSIVLGSSFALGLFARLGAWWSHG